MYAQVKKWAIVLAALIRYAGCSHPETSATKPAALYTWKVRNKDKTIWSGRDDGSTLNIGQSRLVIRDGRVIGDSRDFGPVSPGDEILLDENGSLFVNDKERKAN